MTSEISLKRAADVLTISEVFRDLGDFADKRGCREAAKSVAQGLKNVASSAQIGEDGF